MEELQESVSAKLLTLLTPDLIEVCHHIKCSGPVGGFEGQSRRALIRLVEKTLDEIEENEEDKELFVNYLRDLLSMIETLNVKPTKTHVDSSELENLKKEYAQLQQAQSEVRRTLEGQIGALEEKLKAQEAPAPTASSVPEVTLRKEFRIFGQIGEAGQKEKLSYTSLSNQIESGLKKGYTETEIIEAVIRAVSPGLHLRELLEIKRNLTLQSLKTILRGHYKVDSTSDLLHRLMNITQDPKESAQSFLFRAIELREKLLRTSGDEEVDEQFSQELIQKKFLRSVETGLLSDSVKFQIKPHLCNPNITDEILIDRLGEAANLELERQNKLKKTVTPRPLKLNEIQTETLDSGEEAQGKEAVAIREKKKQAQIKGAGTDTTKAIEELRADMMEMTKMFCETIQAARSVSYAKMTPLSAERRPRGCKPCQDALRGETCNHCYRCGQDGNLSRGCRQRKPEQGKDRGLLSRDPQ